MNDILKRLENGESAEAIGQEFADLLNKANDTYKASIAANELASRKKELASKMIDLTKEYVNLVAPEIVNEDLDSMNDPDTIINMLDSTIESLKTLTTLATKLETAASPSNFTRPSSVKMSDDEAIANFIKKMAF